MSFDPLVKANKTYTMPVDLLQIRCVRKADIVAMLLFAVTVPAFSVCV